MGARVEVDFEGEFSVADSHFRGLMLGHFDVFADVVSVPWFIFVRCEGETVALGTASGTVFTFAAGWPV